MRLKLLKQSPEGRTSSLQHCSALPSLVARQGSFHPDDLGMGGVVFLLTFIKIQLNQRWYRGVPGCRFSRGHIVVL